MVYKPRNRALEGIIWTIGLLLLLVICLWLYAHMSVPAPRIVVVKAEVPEFVRELGGIKEYRLRNGLQILLFPDASQSSTTVNINYRVGSRHESAGEYGMAHLLEHMLFKGTPSHHNIQQAAAQHGMALDAKTQADRTYYHASFNANAETLRFALGLEADRMLNSLIAKADLEQELSVLRKELEHSEHDPAQLLSQQVLGVAYQWHNYGHSVAGAPSDIENAPIERLRAFYQRYYRPDNATLLISGRFELQPTLAQIGKIFGPLRAPATPIPQTYTQEPAQDGERSVVVNRVGGEPMLLAFYHAPAITHPDTPALILLGYLLSEQGALYTHLVQTKLAVSANMSSMSGVEAGGIAAMVQLAPKPAWAPAWQADWTPAWSKAESRLLDILEGRNGPALQEADLQRIRSIVQHNYRNDLANSAALMHKILDYGPDWRMLFLLMEELDKVTLADIERVRTSYLRPANRTLGRYIPGSNAARVEIPAAPALDERLAQLKGPPSITQGELFEPTTSNLAQRTQTRQLAKGITLTTLHKLTRGQQVQLVLQLKWGERDAAFRERGHSMLGNLVVQGTSSLSRAQLQARMTQLKANMNIESDHQGATLRIQADKHSLLEVLAIAADVMRNPLLPQQAFDWAQHAMLAELEAGRHHLEMLSVMAVREHYNQTRHVAAHHPDYIASVDDRIATIKATSLQDLKRFHRHYWSANLAQVVAVGDLPEGLDDAIVRLFADWKKPQAPPYVRHMAHAVQFKPAHFSAQASDKNAAAILMETNLALNDRDPDYLPLAVASYIFGNGQESRLAVRILPQAGLSYSVGASLNAAHFGNAANFVISGTFTPQKHEKMLALVQDELRRMSRDGITEAELARCKHAVQQTLQQARNNDEILADELLRQLDNGEDWGTDEGRDHELAGLTLAQVNAAWRKYIQPDQFVIVTVGDFSP